MRNYKILLFGLSLILLLLEVGCEDVYYPKEILNVAQVPIIQGIITEGSAPVVTLSWSMGYNDKTQDYIYGAQVVIKNDLGDSIQLTENGAGQYSTSNLLYVGLQGRTYVMSVKLPDGSMYISTPEYLHSKPQIDSLYAVPGITTVYSYNSDNQPIGDNQKGLTIYSDLSSNTDTSLFYRFNTKIITEMNYAVDVGTLAEHSVFVWQASFLDNAYSVDFSAKKNNLEVLPQHKVGFLHYFDDESLMSNSRTATYISCWVLTFNVYSISRDVYNYYNSINQQLNANNQIFAPNPSQVLGNVRCVNDPGRAVIGVFEASSLTKVYKAFSWIDLSRYKSAYLNNFPDWVFNGSLEKFMPDWWIRL